MEYLQYSDIISLHSTLQAILQIPRLCTGHQSASSGQSPVMIVWENLVTLVTLFIMQSPKGCMSKTHLLDESVQLFVSVIQEGQPKVFYSYSKMVNQRIITSNI